MTLAIAAVPRSIHGRAYKTARRNGQSIVVQKMPSNVWMTADQVAALLGKPRKEIAPHLHYAWKIGRVRKRHSICECCGKRCAQWKRS